MSTKQTEALKLALEALETLMLERGSIYDKAIAALREALAEQPVHQHIEHCLWARNGNTPCPHVQPAQQQEPAGAVYRYGKDSSGKPWHGVRWTASGLDLPDGTLIYTSPPASKPLSNFAKAAIYAKHFGNPVPDAWYAAINDLEAAHGITKGGGV